MSRLIIRSTCRTAVAAALIFAMLARVPFADGLMLHDHHDEGVHSHAVTIDDLSDGDLRAAWYRDHDDNSGNRSNEWEGGAHGDSLLILFTSTVPIRRSCGTVIASVQHPPSKVLPRWVLPSDPTEACRILTARWPSAQPMRPASALDALLQSSQALLL